MILNVFKADSNRMAACGVEHYISKVACCTFEVNTLNYISCRVGQRDFATKEQLGRNEHVVNMWPSWTESIQKRVCRYLLQRYLGQYFQEKLSLDQLNVDVLNGTGNVNDVVLDSQVCLPLEDIT